jgi:hypothetical protein
MSRIYQGRASKVEIPNPGDKANPWQLLPDWSEKLRQHHKLFQDAVNLSNQQPTLPYAYTRTPLSLHPFS